MKITRARLGHLIDTYQRYYSDASCPITPGEINAETLCVFGGDILWATGIMVGLAIRQSDTETYYAVLSCLGIEAVDE